MCRSDDTQGTERQVCVFQPLTVFLVDAPLLRADLITQKKMSDRAVRKLESKLLEAGVDPKDIERVVNTPLLPLSVCACLSVRACVPVIACVRAHDDIQRR